MSGGSRASRSQGRTTLGPHQGRFWGSGQGVHFRVVPTQGGRLVCFPLSHQAPMCSCDEPSPLRGPPR